MISVQSQVIRDRKAVLEEQIKSGETPEPMAGRRYLDFLDILLTSKVRINEYRSNVNKNAK